MGVVMGACSHNHPHVASATTLPQARLRRRVRSAQFSGASHRHREFRATKVQTSQGVLFATTRATCPGSDASAVGGPVATRSEEHTSELPSLMRISYAVF